MRSTAASPKGRIGLVKGNALQRAAGWSRAGSIDSRRTASDPVPVGDLFGRRAGGIHRLGRSHGRKRPLRDTAPGAPIIDGSLGMRPTGRRATAVRGTKVDNCSRARYYSSAPVGCATPTPPAGPIQTAVVGTVRVSSSSTRSLFGRRTRTCEFLEQNSADSSVKRNIWHTGW